MISSFRTYQETTELVCCEPKRVELAKPVIVAIASQALEGKQVQDIITDFELGNIPQLDNTSVQMALVALTEELKGSIFIEKALTEERAPQFGKLQSIGIRSFCETLLNIPVNISVIEDLVSQDLFEKATTDKYVAKISKLLESTEKETVTPAENVQLNNLDDFQDFLKKLEINNLEQTPYQAHTTQPNENFETLQLDNHELYCNIVLTLALRLCEPIEIEQIVQEYSTSNKYEICTKALRIIKSSLHQKHYNLSDIQSFIHPTDYKPEKIEKIISIYTNNGKSLESPLRGTSIRVVEPHISLAQALKAAGTIEKSIKSASDQNITFVEESILKIGSLREPLTQIGLVKMAEPFFPTAILQEIVPTEILKDESYLECIGTYLMIKIMGNTSHNVEELTEYFTVEDFSNHNLENTSRIVASLHANALLEPATKEIAMLTNYEPLEKGIKVMRNIVSNNYAELAINDVIKYFDVRKFQNFDDPQVQMAFISIAKRISNPLIVEDLIGQEIRKEDTNNLPLLGFKILAEVVHSNPYEISNIDNFVLPEDLAPFTTNKEIAFIENVYQEMNTPQISRENILISSKEASVEAVKAIPNFILECKECRNVSMEVPELITSKFKELDNIPAQAAMLQLASQFASLPVIYDILAMEMLKHENILPVIGAVALQKITELNSIETEDVQTLLQEKGLDSFQRKQSFIIWENVASFLQTSKVYFFCTSD